MACCQRSELAAPRIEERIRSNNERAGLPLSHGCKRCVDLAFVTGAKDRHFLPQRTSGCLRGAHFDFAARMVWIHEISNDGSLRNELVYQLHSFSHRCGTEYGDTSDIASWPVKTSNKAFPDRITVSGEHDRNRLGCRLSRLRRRFATS